MKKLNKLLSIMLCLTLLCAAIPVIYADAEEVLDENSAAFELYRLSFGTEGVALEGRFFEKANCRIFFELRKGTTLVVSQGTTSNSDGSFAFDFYAELENTTYTMSVSAENGAKTELDIDLSPHASIYELGTESGYNITGISYAYDAVFIEGTHSGTENGVVSLRVMDGEKLITISQAISDESGAFEIEFKTPPGDYTLHLMAEGLSQVSCDYSEPGFANIFEKDRGDEENVSLLAETLGGYVKELKDLSDKCRQQNISTDYEDAYTAIIEEFITYIENETSLGLYDRMGQYYYTFKPLYEETKDTLSKYLSGEKEPMTVSRFKTGDVEFDGVVQTATQESEGVREQKPTFFVGYGHWQTAAEKIPLFEKLGFNITTTEIMMKDVIVPGVFDGWTDTTSKNDASEFSLDKNNTKSGKYSFKITNPDVQAENNDYRMLTQRIEVKPGTTYTVGLCAMGSGILNNDEVYNEASAWFSVTGLKGDGRTPIENSDDWRSYEYEYTTASNEDYLDLTILSSYGVEELYIDDVYVSEKGTAANLAVNGSFDDVPEPRTEAERAILGKGWYINYDKLEWLEGVLENAEEHNMLVDMCLCLSFMPEFILKSDADAQRHKEYFLPFVMENNTMKEASVLWARLLCETLEKYDCIHSLCLLNEPEVHTNGICSMEGHSYDDGYYLPYWYTYLEEKYTDIERLNDTYGGTAYKKFEEVAMPTGIENTPLFYDYREFNDEILAAYIEWISGEVKKYFPDISVHTKMMDYFTYGYARMLQNGANFEKTAEFTDLNGCDGFSYYRYTSHNYTKTPLELKMGWYDYMTSVNEAPVWDTESHISNDYAVPEYDDLIPYYTGADVWNGAIHGRGAQIIWLWDLRRGSLPGSWSNYPNANAVLRPADVVQVSKTALDLNRLSEEITALQKEKAKIGLLYSRTTLGYNDDYMNQCADAYKQIIYSGQKAGFVTDTKPEDMHKYELLVIPEATHLPEKVIEEIEKYEGEILILGADSLKYNEYNKAHDTERISAIFDRADTASGVADKIEEMNLSEVMLVDADTGERINETEWTYTKNNDKYLVNILNYNNKFTKNIKIILNGREVKTITELRSGAMTEDGVLAAEPYKPMLISFDISTFDVLEEGGNVIKQDIGTLQSGIIRYNAQADGSIVYALYKDDVLLDVSIGDETINVNLSEDGNYRLMATVWDMETMSPLSACRTLRE